MAALRRARWGLPGKVVRPQSANSSKCQPYAKVLISVQLHGCGPSNQGFLGGILLADHSCCVILPICQYLSITCDSIVSSLFLVLYATCHNDIRVYHDISYRQVFHLMSKHFDTRLISLPFLFFCMPVWLLYPT